MNKTIARRALALTAALMPFYAIASSHREAPNIAGLPRVDASDFYLFRSYEPGRSGYVVLIANYIPLQDPAGGPNFYDFDPNALYQINIDNTGAGTASLKFQFRFTNTIKGLAVPAGNKQTPVPLINIGAVTPAGTNVNITQSFVVAMTRGGEAAYLTNAATGSHVFYKPVDNIGEKSIPDYAAYAGNFLYEVTMPGCATPARLFVGQRKEGFVANLGEIFDLLNLNPAGPRNAQPNTLSGKNVTSIALELPISCVTLGSSRPVIGAWTTAYLPQAPGQYAQVSRLGMPLVNELVIGLPDKDKFNGSTPINDAQFLGYVTNPSLPVLLNVLFGAAATVPATPRSDLVAAFLTGVKGVNQPPNPVPSEMLRLNTATPPTPPAAQNDLGLLGADPAGFPNGRRPYDDVVDITLRVAEGALCGAIGNCGTETADPNHGTPYTDGAESAGADAANPHLGGAVNPIDTYLDGFPFLNNPLPGSPNGATITP